MKGKKTAWKPDKEKRIKTSFPLPISFRMSIFVFGLPLSKNKY